MADKFTLYGIALSGPTYKAALMLSLCGQKFSYRHMNLQKGEHKTPEHLARNRYGQVPVLEHGATTLVQSGVILEYLAETLGKLAGKGRADRLRSREWLFWEQDRLSPGIFVPRAARRGFFPFDAKVVDFMAARGNLALAVLDGTLATTPYLTGAEPSFADVGCYGVVAFAGEGGFELSAGVAAWAKRMESLPGFKAPSDLLPMSDID